MGGDNTWSAWEWGDIHVILQHSNLLVRVQDIHTQSLTTSFFIIEKKNKQLCQEMGCQRHNSEAVIHGLEERIKEKDKQHRLVSSWSVYSLC